jgi:hypothetical protein
MWATRFIFLFSYISMTLTKKINYKNHKTRRYRGGMMKALFKGMFSKGDAPRPLPPPPPEISADNVRLFNALNLGWQIQPDSTDYEIFNVAQNADDLTIRGAYATIANAIRPFAEASVPERREYLRLRTFLRDKRDNLLDPALRQEYNELLRLYPRVPPNPPTPPPSPPGTPRGPPVPPIAPPPPVVARGANVTFAGTQVPNNILKQSGAVPPPILQTNVGRTLLDFIELVNRDLKSKGKRATAADIRLAKDIINTAEKMLDYPESSNLENYIQLTLFLDNASVEPLVLALPPGCKHYRNNFQNSKVLTTMGFILKPVFSNSNEK